MPLIHCHDTGKTLDTAQLPSTVEPVFCCECGGRLGWADTDHLADTFVGWCDDCAADLKTGCAQMHPAIEKARIAIVKALEG